jgi:hypothetical protein
MSRPVNTFISQTRFNEMDWDHNGSITFKVRLRQKTHDIYVYMLLIGISHGVRVVGGRGR